MAYCHGTLFTDKHAASSHRAKSFSKFGKGYNYTTECVHLN